jgi:hypothetical protein
LPDKLVIIAAGNQANKGFKALRLAVPPRFKAATAAGFRHLPEEGKFLALQQMTMPQEFAALSVL